MQRTIDPALFTNAVKIPWLGVVVTSLKFNQRQFVRRVPVNLVRTHVYEDGLGTALASSLKQIDSSDRVYVKVNERNVARLVVRGLSCAMNNQVERRRLEQRKDGIAIANVQREMLEV